MNKPSWIHFPILALRLEVVMLDSFRLPLFAGSLFRGVMGWALKEVCSPRVYSYLFETTSNRPGQSDASRPFILVPPTQARQLRAGDRLTFELRLLGQGCDYLPEFTDAVMRAGERGLGKKGARFELNKILVREGPRSWVCYDSVCGWAQAYQPLPSALGAFARLPLSHPGTIQLAFETPTRLVIEGEPTREPSFETVMRALYRRLNVLLEVHGGGWDQLTLLDCLDELREIEATHNVEWVDWERTSNRQRQRHLMGGLVGVSQYWGPFRPEWLALLAAGEVLNIGKAATFGMGCYHLLFPEDEASFSSTRSATGPTLL